MRAEFDVPAKMRDDVTLRANVYWPDGPGPWPTLLTRTPYGKDDHRQDVWSGVDPLQAARQGFMVVVQDVRGRFSSDGEFEAFRFEGPDGYDSVEWAARLPGSNGRIGMYSSSYCAVTQLLAAAERPRALAAISPGMTWSDPMDGLFGRGGAVELGLALRWGIENGFDSIARLVEDATELRRRVDAMTDAWDGLRACGYSELPVDGSSLRRLGAPDLGAFLAIRDPGIADRGRISGRYGELQVPSFHLGGWYDIFSQGTLDNYSGMAASGRDTRLLVGPWTHQTFGDPVGEELFGLRAGRDTLEVDAGQGWGEVQLGWLGSHLTSQRQVEAPAAPIRIFVMGRNEWREETSWPPLRSVEESWFLRAGGSLASAPPLPGEEPSEFVYDPGDPAPTLGGHGVLAPGYVNGPVDQARLEARDDVVVFTSDPLTRELEVTGRVRVVLYADSSAVSTDWVARLCDVHPNGRSMNLCDGILRVAGGASRCVRHEIDLWSTSNVFLPGHCLRVHVTSSSFPRWDRNLNTGQQGVAHWQTARQRVHHAPDCASHILLPVVG